jgi:hypothetical protein
MTSQSICSYTHQCCFTRTITLLQRLLQDSLCCLYEEVNDRSNMHRPILVNPYRKKVPQSVAFAAAQPPQQQQPQNNNMGPQSQRRLTLQGRTHQLQASSHRKKKQKATGQTTLFGDRAFNPLEDCKVCRVKAAGGSSHKAHHPRCWNNRKTKGKDPKVIAAEKEAKRLEDHFTQPLSAAEKFSSRNLTAEVGEAFFAPRTMMGAIISRPATAKDKPTEHFTRPSTAQAADNNNNSPLSPADLCAAVTEKVCDTNFIEEHKDSRAPLAMIAFATVVVEQIVRRRVDLQHHFDGLTMTVPDTRRAMHPQYHSIVGQKLLNVDWQKMYGIDITCPSCGDATMCKDRSNFSKNKILFPIFTIDGPPMWCMTMSMVCPNTACRMRLNANSAEILAQIPEYARSAYPVE